jgi:hypothetical protein
MVEDDLFELIEGVLLPHGAVIDPGEVFQTPPLDVLRFYSRSVRLHWLPFLGRAQSVVAMIRQPVDLAFSTEGCRAWLRRLAMAANGRYPPARGLPIGLTALVLTAEPITADDDGVLASAFVGLARMRAVPLGIFRLNLGQEAISFALTKSPDNLFPEPIALAETLSEHFKRFVTPLEP